MGFWCCLLFKILADTEFVNEFINATGTGFVSYELLFNPTDFVSQVVQKPFTYKMCKPNYNYSSQFGLIEKIMGSYYWK